MFCSGSLLLCQCVHWILERDSCVWPVLLAYSAGMSSQNACWCWWLGGSDEWGKWQKDMVCRIHRTLRQRKGAAVVICCSAKEKTEGLSVGGSRESWESGSCLPGSLTGITILPFKQIHGFYKLLNNKLNYVPRLPLASLLLKIRANLFILYIIFY